MKRFTSTEKWRDPWFRRLSPAAKLLWFYLLDNCDSAGVIELDLEFASIDIGLPIKEKHLTELESRLDRNSNGKLVITRFITFQCGELRASCPPHKPIIKLVLSHNLERVGLDYRYPKASVALDTHVGYPKDYLIDTRQEKEKEKEKDKDKTEGCGEIYHLHSRTALHWLNEQTGKKFREVDSNLGLISARLSEQGVDIEGVKLMIERQVKRWKGTQQEEYLRPETLFGKEKFDGYYAARNMPINENNGATGAKGFDRSKGTFNEGRADLYKPKPYNPDAV